LKIASLQQGFKIDLQYIYILRAIDNKESGNLVKTRKLFANRMAHAESMILEHGPKLDQKSVDVVKNLEWILDVEKLLE